MTVSQQMTTFLNKQDFTGIMYMNTNNEFQSISIISSPIKFFEQNKWFMGQLGNRLSRGPKGT